MAGIVKKRPFQEALDDLMERYDIVDYAFVGRTIMGEVESCWVAGTGKDIVSDRERANMLHSEMERLQVDLIVRTTPNRVEG